MEDEKIFDRVEKKYLVTPEQQAALIGTIRKNMKEDSYFKSGVFNIYFDNDNYDLIIQSIDHPIFKEKLRARSYEGYDKVFLEIKTKLLGFALRHDVIDDNEISRDNNYGYKRRILITHKDYEELVKHKATMLELASRNIETPQDVQIAREIDYFIRYFDLKPKILVYYNRESYVDESGLRITFDTDLRFRTRNLKFVKNSRDAAYFKTEKNIIMEVKAGSALPLWLVHVLSAEHIYPQRFSKIGKIYERIRKENKNV